MSADTPDQIDRLGPWFYDFVLPNGRTTNPSLSEELRDIHRDRLAMLRAGVRHAFPEGLRGAPALDVGCHEGFFCHALRSLGAGDLTGVDVRERNLDKARLIAQALELDRVRWVQADAEELHGVLGDPSAPGFAPAFELTLAYGLLYHCESPIRVLRQIASHTRRAIIIETQLLDETPIEPVEWGRAGYRLEPQGLFALLDESQLHPTNDETGASPLALCPSTDALRHVLASLGFHRFVRIEPPEDANEQLARGKRGVFVAIRGDSP